MGVPAEVAESAIRVSFGPSTNQAAAERFLSEWRKIAIRGKARAA
jgi:cysteine sulfinate desulfinase/cysteine desulfurase-like protein